MICKICKKEYCEKEENNVCQNCSSSSVEYKNNINLKGTSLNKYMKTIRAEKCKNGYLVTIKETRTIFCESDVKKFIKQQGLKVSGESNDDKNNHIIVAL